MSKPSPTPATAREPDVRYLRTTQPVATLVDSSILIDVLANDARWADWSLDQLARLGSQGALVINPIILAEVSPRFERAADLEAALADLPLVREALPWDAAFLAGQAFKVYRQSQGGQDFTDAGLLHWSPRLGGWHAVAYARCGPLPQLFPELAAGCPANSRPKITSAPIKPCRKPYRRNSRR
jgi:predicted nucleic acid-binding protein